MENVPKSLKVEEQKKKRLNRVRLADDLNQKLQWRKLFNRTTEVMVNVFKLHFNVIKKREICLKMKCICYILFSVQYEKLEIKAESHIKLQ